MADRSESIRVEGLAELRRELAKLDDATFTAGLKDAHAEVGELVVGKAKSRAALPVQRKASGSLSASRAAAVARVSLGGAAYPYALGAEFGSTKYRQFPPYLGQTGYFLYPTIRAESDAIERVYWDAIDKITHAAFPD